MFAYLIDRELALQRTPASVVRTLSWADLMALQPYGETRANLMAIRVGSLFLLFVFGPDPLCQDQCSSKGGTTITGMMQGWTKFDVMLLDRVDQVFQEQTFRARFPSSQQLE